MKIKLVLLVTLFASLGLFAQNGINYKAIVKDTNGNVVANSTIDVIFKINEIANNIFSEYHTTTSDNNGLIILNIGEGTATVGDFSTIDWSTNNHFLNVQIGIDGGAFVDLGTTAFKTVPYALNVSGLEKITEAGNTGFRLIGRPAENHGDIGDNSIDLSFSNDVNSASNGATGNYSVAIGLATKASNLSSTALGAGSNASGIISTAIGNFTTASGNFSTSMGSETTASANHATAMGQNSTASANHSLATGNNTEASGIGSSSFGYNTTASGAYSTSMGNLTTANASNSLTIGQYNIGGGNPTQWILTDPIFEIGIGVNSVNKVNALTVLKNGSIIAPSLSTSEIIDSKSLITKEYAELKFNGLTAIDEGNGIGYRLNGKNPNNYGNIGRDAIDFSISDVASTQVGATGQESFSVGAGSIASGFASVTFGSSEASGTYSTAIGFGSKAIGSYSFSVGLSTIATGNNSVSLGDNTQAIGPHSFAMGLETKANANYSSAFGLRTTAYSFNEAVFGRWNTNDTPTSVNSWALNDRLFVIGNGTSDTNRSNALLVLKNGNVGMGLLGNFDPLSTLHVNGADISGNDANSGTLIIGHNNSKRLAIDDDEIMVRSNTNNPITLHLQRSGGDVAVGGSVVHSSDRRLKRDISTLKYGLKEVLQLLPKQYFWKNNTNQKQKSLGVIAQDIQKIIPNVVHEKNDEQKTLSVSYTELIPVLINAIKEQQKVIDNQNNKINGLTAEVATLKSLESRLQQIETLLKNEQ